MTGFGSRLPERWRNEAATLRHCFEEGKAQLLERCAEELEREQCEHGDELLSVRQAAAESGYCEETLRRMVKGGKLPRERAPGRNSHIHIRRSDLPKKPSDTAGVAGTTDEDYDLDEDARNILQQMRGLDG